MSQIELNTPAPDFTLFDFKGKQFQLSGQIGKSNVLLVFNRGFM